MKTISYHIYVVTFSGAFSKPGWTTSSSDSAARSISISSVPSDTVAENAIVVRAATPRVCSEVIARPLATRIIISNWAMP
jgi:hypothetical protein